MNKEEIEHWINRWKMLKQFPRRDMVIKVMNKEEIEHWINRWKMLKQSPRRDMVIKIWSNLLKNKKL